MKVRESLLMIGTLIVLAVAGTVAFGLGSESAGGPPQGSAPVEPDLIEPGVPDVVAVEFAPGEAEDPIVVRLPEGQRPTSGTIDGSIRVASEAAGQFDHFTISVEEAVNTNALELYPDRQPFHILKTFRVTDHSMTPRFVVDKIPFSPLGYRVFIHTPGFNGSSQVVQLTEENWLARVSLAITPGVPFSVRLHDQSRTPLVGRRIVLRPEGHPPGRMMFEGKSDSYGAVVFESVLAGDYRVWVDDHEIDTVQVQSTSMTTNLRTIGVQFAVLEVPIGPALRVEVTGPAGYGLKEAKVVIYAVDTVERRRFEAETDFAGIHTFEHIPPGRYQIDVSATGFQQTSRQITIPEQGDPAPALFRLAN